MAFKIAYPEGYEKIQQDKAQLMIELSKTKPKEALKELPPKESSKLKTEGDK